MMLLSRRGVGAGAAKAQGVDSLGTGRAEAYGQSSGRFGRLRYS
jgi:hypothetical protein